jgi:hypothetical protein
VLQRRVKVPSFWPEASRAVSVEPLFERLLVHGEDMTGEAPPVIAELVIDGVVEDF